ncbi:hypothetical protein EV182_003631 [Spiromyces aspiralis]|uniref:Uncharacterized protein n=1 Tax=Spiromyces aspiralis TaxID=68401 RepID=A0ACC1HEW5_9FUNG|nr:hypothetical protein EV182_003631 [Spiromyces aspiralis]
MHVVAPAEGQNWERDEQQGAKSDQETMQAAFEASARAIKIEDEAAAIHYIEWWEVGSESNEKPFNAGQKGMTMVKYSMVWASVMAYIWRMWHLELVEEPIEEGVNEEEGVEVESEGCEAEAIRDQQPAYRFTAQQTKAFERVCTAAYAAIGAREGSDIESETSSSSTGSTRSRARPASTSTHLRACQIANEEDDKSELEGHILDFFIALLDHDIGDNEFQNALYSGLAILGIQAEHGWCSALVYTPVLLAIVTVAHMLVLYKAKRAHDDEVLNWWQLTGESEAKAREQVRSHFDWVRNMVWQFMMIMAFNGQPSPMDSVLRLRAYGKAIRANTNADGVVDWHGDELLIGRVQFGMASLWAMIHGLLHVVRAQLWQAVLLLDMDEDGEPAAVVTPGGEPGGATAWPAIR